MELIYINIPNIIQEPLHDECKWLLRYWLGHRVAFCFSQLGCADKSIVRWPVYHIAYKTSLTLTYLTTNEIIYNKKKTNHKKCLFKSSTKYAKMLFCRVQDHDSWLGFNKCCGQWLVKLLLKIFYFSSCLSRGESRSSRSASVMIERYALPETHINNLRWQLCLPRMQITTWWSQCLNWSYFLQPC